MRLSQETISQRYAGKDPRTQEFIINVFADIKKNSSEFNNYFICMLDLLCQQLEVYFMAVDAVDNERKLTSRDKYERIAKNPAVTVMNKAHQEIIKILNEFSMSPFGKAKLKRVQSGEDEASAESLLHDLTA